MSRGDEDEAGFFVAEDQGGRHSTVPAESNMLVSPAQPFWTICSGDDACSFGERESIGVAWCLVCHSSK